MTLENPHIDTLAVHEFIGMFEGKQHVPCRFMTAECPDRCNHAYDAAVFKVLDYLKWEKPGQYGDEKQEIFRFKIKDIFGQKPDILEKLKNLQEGKKYRVVYHHLYINDGQAKRPERPVIEITPFD